MADLISERYNLEWPLHKATMTTALREAFVRRAIDNRGSLTSTRQGAPVAHQIIILVEQYLADQADEDPIAAACQQLAAQGLAIDVGADLTTVHCQTATDTALFAPLAHFQNLFLTKLAEAREIVQQRRQERSQEALQHALRTQLEQQRHLRRLQEERNRNFSRILQLNARLARLMD